MFYGTGGIRQGACMFVTKKTATQSSFQALPWQSANFGSGAVMPFDDFDEITRLTAAFNQTQIADDLNNDMAGRDNGRQTRVIHGDVADTIEARKQRERVDNLLIETALATMLRDPVYRAQYEAFGEFLDTYNAATKTALAQATQNADAAQADLKSITDGASTLNGKPIFVTDDGRIVGADGMEIDPADAEHINWQEGAASFEDYTAAKATAKNAAREVERLKLYQAELDAAQERWKNEKDPIKKAEMEAEKLRLKENAPNLVKNEIQASPTGSTAENGLSDTGQLTLK